MTKAKTDQPEWFKEYKPGTRKCEQCGMYTVGPKSPKCAKCGHSFPPTTSKGKAVKAAVSTSASFSDALTVLQHVKGFIDAHSGYDGATKTLDEVDRLIDACGGVKELRAAMETLKGWDAKK